MRRALVNSLMALTVLLMATGCGVSRLIPRATAPEAPTEQARCKVSASHQNPLVTEWPASEKADLEARLQGGAVAVSYTGCEMRIVSCRLAGKYHWRRTSTSTDVIEIRSEDELYAKLPLGAVSLSGELQQSGRLTVHTSVAGQLRLADLQRSQLSRQGDCAKATHLVTAVSIGAFAMRSGGSRSGRVGVSTPVAGAGIGRASAEKVMRTAGVPERCREATDQDPHQDCRSPIQVFLSPVATFAGTVVSGAAPPAPQTDNPYTTPATPPTGSAPPPGPASGQPPPPIAPHPPAPAEHKTLQERTIAVEFVSAEPNTVFAVVANGQAVCTTPCKQTLPLNTAVRLRDLGKPGGAKNKEHQLRVSLRDYAGLQRVKVSATPFNSARRAGGIVMTAVGGLGFFVGGLVALVGGLKESTGATVGGVVSLVLGGAMLPFGLVFIVGAGENIEVKPVSAPATAGPSLTLRPGHALLRF